MKGPVHTEAQIHIFQLLSVWENGAPQAVDSINPAVFITYFVDEGLNIVTVIPNQKTSVFIGRKENMFFHSTASKYVVLSTPLSTGSFSSQETVHRTLHNRATYWASKVCFPLLQSITSGSVSSAQDHTFPLLKLLEHPLQLSAPTNILAEPYYFTDSLQ